MTIDAAVFTSHAVCALVNDRLLRDATPARDTMAQAVHTLPVGVLCTGVDGRVLFTNDTMRSCLSALELPCDLADLSGIGRNLRERAQRGEGGDSVLAEGLRPQAGPDKTCLFQFGSLKLHGQPCRWIVALDITEQARASDQLVQAAVALAQGAIDLPASLPVVPEVARNEAMLHMKARVHDTIGQRLSILHRYLDSNDSDPEKLEQMVSLLHDITADLDSHAMPTTQAELGSIRNAFSLIGVDIIITGELPDDPATAVGYTRIIREASTNAVKHGHTKRVTVDIIENEKGRTLRVSNDGVAASERIRFGTGLPGMNETAKALGASLTVTSYNPFTIVVKQKLQ